jgi:hypothetical protein
VNPGKGHGDLLDRSEDSSPQRRKGREEGELFQGHPQDDIFFEPPPLTAVQKEGFLCVLCASAVNIVFFTTA